MQSGFAATLQGHSKPFYMKRTAQLTLLDSLENQVELHLQESIRIFQNLPAEALLKPASNGGWSIAQCLEHLNSYGDFYLPEIAKALQGNQVANPAPTFKSGWLGSYFTQMMQPGSRKKMKAFKNHIPAAQLDPAEVVATFIQQQETLLKYLRLAKRADLHKRLPISISRFVRLQLGDVFQFVIAHDERHIQQAKRQL